MSGSRSEERAVLETLMSHAEITTDNLHATMVAITDIGRVVRAHTTLLQEIRKVVMPKSDDGEETRLEQLLGELVRQGHEHSEGLLRIEAALAKR